jgi:hypothetical protein
MADATGERQEPLRVTFDRRLKLEFHGARITSDGGLLAYRELDDALGLTTAAASALAEGRRGKNIRHRLLGLLRQAIYGRLAGYEDVNDAERLSRDPAMRAIVGREGMDRLAASSSEMGRFETEWLATEANLAALTALSGTWVDQVHARRPPDGIILDIDSSESPTFGQQEGSAWNGHFRCACYHPLFLFNQFGDLERCMLRPGNVHSAEGWREVLKPVIARYRDRGLVLYFRGDAALRSLVLPNEVAQWTLTTLRERLVKIGARIVRHGRYLVFQLAEVVVPRSLFAAILYRIERLRGPPVAAT